MKLNVQGPIVRYTFFVAFQRILAGLKSKGHITSPVDVPPGMSFVNAIRSNCTASPAVGIRQALSAPNCVQAVADGRAGGLPDGF